MAVYNEFFLFRLLLTVKYQFLKGEMQTDSLAAKTAVQNQGASFKHKQTTAARTLQSFTVTFCAFIAKTYGEVCVCLSMSSFLGLL